MPLRPCCSRTGEPWIESCGTFCLLPRSCGSDEAFVFWVFCRKAEEYLRLSQVKCTGLLAQMTATSSAVMCLDLAASFMKQPVDKVRACDLAGWCILPDSTKPLFCSVSWEQEWEIITNVPLNPAVCCGRPFTVQFETVKIEITIIVPSLIELALV